MPETPTTRRRLHEPRNALRERVILDAINQLGLEPKSLPPNVPGQRAGVRLRVKQKALLINADAFGPGGKDKAFEKAWDEAHHTQTLKYADQ